MNLVTPDPLRWCALRWKQATRKKDAGADLLHLATVDLDGGAAVRVLLLKACDRQGFGFVTNAMGAKVTQWEQQPIVAASLYWGTLGIQIRIRGTIKPMLSKDIDALWRPRPRDAKLVYHMGIAQSAPISGPQFLATQFRRTEKEWRDCTDIPRAPTYVGYTIVPQQIELFHHSTIRLNQRIRYTKTRAGWKTQWLAP